jgi:CxxC motif-containing protein (DUF1111 family)
MSMRAVSLVLPLGMVVLVGCRDERNAPLPTSPASATSEILIASATALGDPLPGLTAAQQSRFDRGRLVFETVFEESTGLGPLFNAASCAECHEAPVVGGVGDEVEVHATRVRADGTCANLAAKGGPVFQQDATASLQLHNIFSEPIPANAQIAHRTIPDLFGFGLLDAVPESAILALADEYDMDGDGISGRPNLDGNRVGRFGRKAQVASLRDFNDGAFLAEMGITSPTFPQEGTIGGDPIPPGVDGAGDPEITQGDLVTTNAFVRFLAPAPRPSPTAQSIAGAAVFSSLGCASCHVPTLRTGDVDAEALANRDVHAFTDLLLHDMGPALADICLGRADPAEFRTEPLMGIRLDSVFLHDGRATSLGQAIRLHGGEGQPASDRFRALPATERAALIAYLKTL